MREQSVILRNHRRGLDQQHLQVKWVEETGLVVEGHDLGPGTAPVSDGGDYEYRYEIPMESIPELLRRLGADADVDVITVLRAWTGERSYEFERLAWGLRTNFWCWP